MGVVQALRGNELARVEAEVHLETVDAFSSIEISRRSLSSEFVTSACVDEAAGPHVGELGQVALHVGRSRR